MKPSGLSTDLGLIRPASPREGTLLTSLSLASKAVWGYTPEEMSIFEQELQVSPTYIRDNRVFVYDRAGGILAWYSLKNLKEEMVYPGVTLHKGWWLDHLFVDPSHLRQGIGAALLAHMNGICSRERLEEIQVLSDPHARAFYEKAGFRYVRDYPSSIAGRTVPFLVYRWEH